MKKILFALSVACVALVGCSEKERPLATNELGGINVFVETRSPLTKLKITGQVLVTDLGVSKVETRDKNGDMNIVVYGHPKDASSKEIVHEVMLPAHVSRITLGEEEKLIWSR